MLVIKRKRGQVIRVGENVKIIVGQISPNQVSLIFDAPVEVKIIREEVLLKEEQKRPR